LSHCKSGHVGITVEAVEFPGVGAESLLARVTDDLADAAADVFAILAAATTSLSRVQQGTWIAVLMDPDPSTSHVLVADDSDGAMATYMNQFVGALTGPAGTPTLAMSQRVIESSSPLLIPGVPFDEFISILSPAGQDYSCATRLRSRCLPSDSLSSRCAWAARRSGHSEDSIGVSNPP